MRNKYIVVDVLTRFRPVRTAIVFPETLSHAEMASALRCKNEEFISAGFFQVHAPEGQELQVNVYGESIGLHLKPAEGDADLIAKAIGIHTSSY